jgi:NAD-dependent dihydropyrimidine dehydrogenase PreA subunit
MPKTWHPIVDYSKCTNCGYCIDLCGHNVYEKSESPVPIVKFPEKCLEGCKYCAVMCPEKAIKYLDGDEECDCDGGRFCSCCG